MVFFRLAQRKSAEGAETRDGLFDGRRIARTRLGLYDGWRREAGHTLEGINGGLMEDEAAAGMEGDLGAGFFVEGEGGEGWFTGL